MVLTPTRREFVSILGLGAVGLLGAACAPAAPASQPTTLPPTAPPAPAGSASSAGASAVPSASPAAAAASAVPSVGPSVNRPTTTVKVTDIQITSAAGSYIADARGYFRDEGLQAEFLTMTGADQAPALVSGTADVAGTAINAALYNALARGLPIKLVADHGANLKGASASGWVVRKDLADTGAYKGPADLKGKKVAVGTPTSTNDVEMDRFLREGGLTIKDVDLLVLNFPDMISAFASKALDGAIFQEPFTTLAVEQGFIVRGPIGYDIYPNQQIAALTFGQRLSGDRDLALAYLRGYIRGVRDYVKGIIQKDQKTFDEIVPILIDRTTVKDRSLFQRAIPSGLKPDPTLNVQSIKDDQDWMVEMGAVTQKADIDKYVDLSTLEEALRQVGPFS